MKVIVRISADEIGKIIADHINKSQTLGIKVEAKDIDVTELGVMGRIEVEVSTVTGKVEK